MKVLISPVDFFISFPLVFLVGEKKNLMINMSLEAKMLSLVYHPVVLCVLLQF